MPLDRGGFSGDLTDFSSINWTLCAVKRTEVCDESHFNLTLCYGKSSVTTSAVLLRVYLTWKQPTPLDRGEISGDLTDFSSTNWTLCAVKRTEEFDESYLNLTSYYFKSSVTTSANIRCVYLICKYPTPLDRGEISGDLAVFSSTNWTLCAVKRTEECHESYSNPTPYYGKSSVTTSANIRCMYLIWKHPTPLDRGEIS